MSVLANLVKSNSVRANIEIGYGIDLQSNSPGIKIIDKDSI